MSRHTISFVLISFIIVGFPFACSISSRRPRNLPSTKAASQLTTEATPTEIEKGESSDHTSVEGIVADETLLLENIPPLPDQLKRRLGRYLEARIASVGGLADDGRSMLISTRFGETYQTHLLRKPMGARQQVTFRSEPVHDSSFVPGSTRSMLYISDQGGDEAYQIFRLDLDTRKTTLLTDGKSRHGRYVWSKDGKMIAYTGNARNGKDMDLYLGNGVHATSGQLLLERQGHWNVLDWSPNGKRLLVATYRSINDAQIFIVEIANKKVTRVTPKQPTASYRSALFDQTGKKLFVATDRGSEFVELFEVNLERQSWKPLTRDIRWNVEELALSPSGRTLAFMVNEEGYGVLYLFDTRHRKYRRIDKLPKGLVRGLEFARQAEVLSFTVSTPTSPGDAYTYDLRRRRLTRWTRSEIGGVDPKRFITPILIRYRTFDGKKIPCFVYKPSGPGPHPVVLLIHGGPESQARPAFRAFIQYLAVESGIAVLLPNVRGSDGYGKSYLLLDNGFKREDSVKDIGSLLDWIKDQRDLDQNRVGVLGGSYGGYMVLASLVHYPSRIVAGVDIVGISNFVTFLQQTKPYRRNLRRAEYGDERDPKMKAFLTKISPTLNARRIKSELFVAHGANDPRVPIGETEQIVKAVKKQGKDVWYMVAKNEGHGFRKKKNRDLFYSLTILFFEKHLR